VHYQKTSKIPKPKRLSKQARRSSDLRPEKEPKEPKEPGKQKGRKEKNKRKEQKEVSFSTTSPKQRPGTPTDSEEEYAKQAAFIVGYNLESSTLFNSTFNLEPEEDSEAPKSSYSTTHSTRKLWLFDTGSIVYICNDKSLFIKLSRPIKLSIIHTRGGTVKLEGVGTVKVEVLAGYKEGTAFYNTLTLTKTLYILGFLLNIVSRHRLYTSGGALIK